VLYLARRVVITARHYRHYQEEAPYMIGYVTLGTNNLERAARFYDKLLGEIGAKRSMQQDRFIAWSVSPTQPGLSLTQPFNREPASVGNGVMVALALKEPQQVDRLHALALELGGTDEGPAGPRGGGFYAGYFRDPDGNKLSFFCIVPS
jgi:catechol 2,3-dioxygenase-like lactoylglutathione lyase family enzyme